MGKENENEGMRLFVGNLPYRTRSEDLRDLFSEAGRVLDAYVVKEKDNPRRSRGFAFVSMATPEEGNKAIEMFHEYEIDGRNLQVNEAQAREQGRGGGRD